MTFDEFCCELQKRGYLKRLEGAPIAGYEFTPVGEINAALLLQLEGESIRTMHGCLTGLTVGKGG